MKVIKEAFHEGRETDVSWEDSNAKQDQLKLEVYASNTENFNSRAFTANIPLEQVCVETGKVINRFATRLEAARWVCRNVLDIPEANVSHKAMSITGNMHMCMIAGWKSYGYYWRFIKPAEYGKAVQAAAKVKGGTMVCVNGRRTSERVYESIAEASRQTGVSSRQIRRVMEDWGSPVNGYSFRVARTKKTHKVFSSLKEAGEFFGVNPKMLSKRVRDGVAINNTTVYVKSER